MDAQGASVAKPFVEKARARFPVLVDRTNLIAGEILGQKAIPLAAMIDEVGMLRWSKISGPDNVRQQILDVLDEKQVAPPRVASGPTLDHLRKLSLSDPKNANNQLRLATAHLVAGNRDLARTGFEKASTLAPDNWMPLFRLGVLLLEEKKPKKAMEIFRKALKLDPQNYLIRKQIWAIENPDKFYKGNVDYNWQQKQMRKERNGG